LLTISRAADPDPWRCRLRDALESKDPKTLEGLAASARGDQLPLATAVLLARLTQGGEAAERTVDTLKQVQRRHPDDFWINQMLALTLGSLKSPRPEDAIRYYAMAVALRPQSPGAHYNLGNALRAMGQLDEAVAE
jgi:predicted Zn-dependent protease